MNVIDRNFSAEVNRIRQREAWRKRRRLALFIAATLILGAAAMYVWSAMLCADCGGLLAAPSAWTIYAR
jgi:hypothetical protein